MNVVAGPGSVCGQRLVEHPDVAKVAFTGSTEVGRGIAESAAATIKRVTLELGGKSANVIFADADLEQARPPRPLAVFGSAGPGSLRALEDPGRRSASTFMVRSGAVEAMKVGDPLDEDTEMGPLISEDQRSSVASYVNGDAPVAIRGPAPEGPASGSRPPSSARCRTTTAREEIFGPVAAVIPSATRTRRFAWPTTIYGLSGSIWTRDGGKALRVARAIETGVISINSNTSVRVTAPFGGFKQSGVGRELGTALEHYTEVKNVYYATG